MLRVRISSQAEDRARKAEQAFTYLPVAMEEIAKFHAEYLRDNDSYRNRTGDLRKHTVGRILEKDSNSVTVELVMGMEYASYVRALGFSDFYLVVKDMSRNLNRAMAGFGKRIRARR